MAVIVKFRADIGSQKGDGIGVDLCSTRAVGKNNLYIKIVDVKSNVMSQSSVMEELWTRLHSLERVMMQ